MQFLKYFFASLLALVAFCFVGVFLVTVLGAALGSKDSVAVEDKSFLTIDLSRAITEHRTKEGVDFSGDGASSYGLFELTRAIEKAALDSKIIGIYLKCGINNNGWATSADLRTALQKFKASKKPIFAYGDYYDQKTLYVASVADSIYVNPIGTVELHGLAATSMFYKGALEKLNVKPTIFYCGKYKGASEPYRLDKYSEPNREQIGALLEDIYSDLCTTLAQRSGKTQAEIKDLAATLAVRHARDAVKHNLITGTAYEGEVLSKMKRLSGINDKYAARLALMSSYSKEVSMGKGADKIAVLFAEGAIADGKANGQDGIYSATIIKDIRAIAANDKIKALVLRVNSPGGSAIASENIYQELMALRKKKPIIVSMGDVAASGGYYMACAGDSIFAQPNTMTGSIGVVGVMFSVQGFLNNKLGVTTDAVKTAPYADFPSVTRDMNPTELAMIQGFLDSTYVVFKQRVSTARKLDLTQVEALAQGHVYTGSDALPIKLIDGMGNLQDCINKASTLAKVSSYRLVTYPAKVDGFQAMISQLTGGDTDARLQNVLGDDYLIYKQYRQLRDGANKLQMRMPWELQIK
jgi:protease IV